ncbi:hypothetical protein C2E20_5468 [Micractinium conductrix]|uniref:Transmembrane protein 135 N-terminal domain-containing protein n=1 Tax=Micractinium conductrix TaxID=554055 RepID=A0A2P6VAR2_9CHLO|nr:hypothetical protein C2E20_5468 [Micractinium conductrix]|eukprot:PSC71174.1 hypothetical protein C2E20_5468 [Micractinium conductrix]
MLAPLVKDTLRYGAFVGSFSGLFVFWDEAIALLGGRKRTAAWRAMASGALAGPALLLTGTKEAHTSLALYIFIRGLTLLARCGNLPEAHPLKRKLLAPMRWPYGGVALMCLSTAQICYSWIALPQTLPSSYVRFLDKHGGKSPRVYAAIREMVQRAAAGPPCAAAVPLAALAGTELAGFAGATPCGVLHPHESCNRHMLSFLPTAYLRALPVYFPVYVIPAILVHRKRLLQPDRAPQLWRKIGVGVLRSSLFLSLYCTLAWRGACATFNMAGRTTGGLIAAGAWIAGLAALVEKRSRRMELALYVMSRAAESFALTLGVWGWVRPSSLPRRVDVLLFSAAAACILHCYSDHYGERRDVFRSTYLNIFDFILGNTGFQSAAISHMPSNAEFVSRGLHTVASLTQLNTLASLYRGGAGNGNGNGSGAASGTSSMRPSAGTSPRQTEEGEEGEEGKAAATRAAGAAAALTVAAAGAAAAIEEAGGTVGGISALERLQDAALRGALAGLTLRGGLHLVTYVLGLLVKGRRSTPASRPDGAAMVKDTLRWGAFLGSFSGLFVFWDEAIALLGGRKRTAAWRAMASGALAGPALLLTGTQQSHTSLSLFVFVRGLTLLVRCGNLPEAHPLKRKLLAPTRWQHGDVALMCLSAAQLGYSWLGLPETLPRSYVRFLDKHAGKAPHVYAAIREMTRRAAAGAPGPAAVPLAALAGTDLAGFADATPCGFLHPHESCNHHMLSHVPPAYVRALPVYFSVYVIPAILVHRKRLLQPDCAPQLWRKIGLGVLRSSLFLALCSALGWRGVCLSLNAAGRTTSAALAAGAAAAGLAVLVEKKSRRIELALYCLSRAAESFALTLGAWGWVRPSSLPRRVDVLLFSAAAACILHCYSDHYGERRDVFKSSYLNTFDFILGNTGFHSASISHAPSNAQLLLRGMRSVKSLGQLVRGGSGVSGNGGGSGAASGASSLRPSPQISPRLTEEGQEGEEGAAAGADDQQFLGSSLTPPEQSAAGESSSSQPGSSGKVWPAAALLAALRAYDRAVKANPVLTKALTSFVGFAIGDRIAQGVAGGGSYDVLRCGRLSLYGLLLDGPVGHAWYKLLDKHVYPEAPTSTKAVLIKMALDQLVWGPAMTLVFFAFLKTLEGHPELIVATIQAKFLPTMLANYVLWPLAHLVNFRFVPTDYRILFNNVVAIFWTTWLSYTCGPAAGSSGASAVASLAGGPGGGEAAAAAAAALLSAIPCHKIPGALSHPEVAEAARQVAAMEHLIAAWGTKSLPSTDLVVQYLHLKAELAKSVCQQPIRLP